MPCVSRQITAGMCANEQTKVWKILETHIIIMGTIGFKRLFMLYNKIKPIFIIGNIGYSVF